MSKEHFNQLMSQYSSEAEGQRAAEARLHTREARREKVKQALIGVLVVALCAYVAVHNAEIRDTVAKYFPSKEPEYRSILAVADEVAADNAGDKGAANDPNARKARLKEALQRAKDHAAVVDEIMDSTAPPKKSDPKKK